MKYSLYFFKIKMLPFNKPKNFCIILYISTICKYLKLIKLVSELFSYEF